MSRDILKKLVLIFLCFFNSSNFVYASSMSIGNLSGRPVTLFKFANENEIKDIEFDNKKDFYMKFLTMHPNFFHLNGGDVVNLDVEDNSTIKILAMPENIAFDKKPCCNCCNCCWFKCFSCFNCFSKNANTEASFLVSYITLAVGKTKKTKKKGDTNIKIAAIVGERIVCANDSQGVLEMQENNITCRETIENLSMTNINSAEYAMSQVVNHNDSTKNNLSITFSLVTTESSNSPTVTNSSNNSTDIPQKSSNETLQIVRPKLINDDSLNQSWKKRISNIKNNDLV